MRRRGNPLPPHAVAGLALCLASLGSRVDAQQSDSAVGPQPARAARVLPRGTVLSADDIMVLGDALPAELPLGWVTRRVIQQGEALRAPAIGRAPVVHSGLLVVLRAGDRRISVTRTGTALEDGAPGDTIRVRLDRGATINAIVRDSTTVVPAIPFRP